MINKIDITNKTAVYFSNVVDGHKSNRGSYFFFVVHQIENFNGLNKMGENWSDADKKHPYSVYILQKYTRAVLFRSQALRQSFN